MKSLALRTLLLLIVALPAAGQSPDSRAVAIIDGADGTLALEAAAGLAAQRFPGAVLIETPRARAGNQRFLEQFEASRVFTACRPGHADRLVVCRSHDRRLQLAAAGLAVAAGLPLCLAPGDMANGEWTVGDGGLDEASAQAAAIKLQTNRARIDTIVLANPTDPLAAIAPLALRGRNAVLLLTDDRGGDADTIIRQALNQPELSRVETLLVLGSPAAIPPERRENPLTGKDVAIEMEPGTPRGDEPYTLAIGRLFHADLGIAALTLARARLLPADGAQRTALVASNPGGSLPMLETFSRTSIRELRGCGYRTTSLVGDELSAAELRRQLPAADVFLWEGHHNTLIHDWSFTTWSEPLRPSFVFLQSCLALTEEKTAPLFDRGALAVVGSSSRIYSATGGAFSLSCLDAVLYDRQSLGGAVRSAKNYLLAYGKLKEKRLGQPKLVGANQRSAWAFTLWGDPDLRLPAPNDPPAETVHATVNGNSLVLSVPPPADDATTSGVFRAVYRPNERLAGLVRPAGNNEKQLVPLAFAEVRLANGPDHAVPRLRSKIPENNWVFLWDARRRTGWLLVALPAAGERDFRFRVEWTDVR